jgi:hypothetical protein
MIYAFPTLSGALIVIEADNEKEGRAAVIKAGYAIIEGEFEEGTILVLKAERYGDVYVSEAK